MRPANEGRRYNVTSSPIGRRILKMIPPVKISMLSSKTFWVRIRWWLHSWIISKIFSLIAVCPWNSAHVTYATWSCIVISDYNTMLMVFFHILNMKIRMLFPKQNWQFMKHLTEGAILCCFVRCRVFWLFFFSIVLYYRCYLFVD